MISVPDPEFGALKMQNVFPRLSRTPGRIRFPGARHGQHQDEVISELEKAGKIKPDVAARLKALTGKVVSKKPAAKA